MSNRDIEQKLYEEFEEQKPELFQEILKHTPKMTEQKQPESIWQRMKDLMTQTRVTMTFATLTAALVFVLILFNPLGSTTPQAYSTIAIDVNPSVVLKLDEEDRVIEVIKNNTDADIIIGNMDLIGVDSNVAVNALIGSMVANGFLTEFTNSVLLSVQSNDSVRENELKQTFSTIIRDLISGTAINGSVITQSLDLSDEAMTVAETYDISEAKAELILDIITIDPRMSLDALSLLSINDLNLLLDAKNYALDNVTKSGSASELELITTTEAFDFVLAHLELDNSLILDYDIELEQEDGVMVYDIDIETALNEYEVIIDAKLGTILNTETESIDEEPDEYPADVLSISAIKTLIIDELGLDYHLISEWDIELEVENGIAVYHIEVHYLDNDIHLEVNADTGEIYSNSYDESGFNYQDDEIEDEEDEEDEEDKEDEEDDN